MDQETIDQQWPGFEVKCKACGSTLVQLENTMGYSDMSGGWGSIDFVCLSCAARAEIVDS